MKTKKLDGIEIAVFRKEIEASYCLIIHETVFHGDGTGSYRKIKTEFGRRKEGYWTKINLLESLKDLSAYRERKISQGYTEVPCILPPVKREGLSGPSLNRIECKTIYAKAVALGKIAYDNASPTPMIVAQHENQLDDTSKIEKVWHVSEGACGLAWVTVHPGNSAFGRYLKKLGYGKAYEGGIHFSPKNVGQSMERKIAWAGAVQSVLNDNGIKAYANSRLD